MKTPQLLTAAALLAVTGCALVSAPASAAPATTSASSAFSSSPTIVEVGGRAVDQRTDSSVTLRDIGLRPTFTTLAGGAAQVGSRMVLTDLDSGATICEADVRPDLLATCSPDHDLAYGATSVEARAVDAAYDSTSDPSDELSVAIGLPTPTIAITGYDSATKKVSVAGTAAPEVTSVTLGNVGPASDAPVDPLTGRWHGEIVVKDAAAPITATIGVRDVSSVARTWLPGAELEAPQVSATTAFGTATLRVVGTPGGWATVYDADGRAISGGTFSNGRVDISVPVTDRETRFTVTQQKGQGPESDPAPIVINQGKGEAAPAAPKIGRITARGSRVVVPVSGEPGSVVTVRSLDGKMLAVRALGASGSAQIVATAPAFRSAASAVFTAEQSAAGATSGVTVFTSTTE
jgi:hypothetical protein